MFAFNPVLSLVRQAGIWHSIDGCLAMIGYGIIRQITD
jgi:hypothetical protein